MPASPRPRQSGKNPRQPKPRAAKAKLYEIYIENSAFIGNVNDSWWWTKWIVWRFPQLRRALREVRD